MTIMQHTWFSSALAAVLWWLAGPVSAMACMAAGVLIDVDHIVDYVLNYPRQKFGIKHFFRVFKHDVLTRVFVLLHAWELVAAAWLAAWRSGWQPVLLGVAAGLGLHLLLDQFFNAHHPAAYFLTYRAWHRFGHQPFYGDREIRRRLALSATCTDATQELTSKEGQSQRLSP